jgi:hypothetical protein
MTKNQNNFSKANINDRDNKNRAINNRC